MKKKLYSIIMILLVMVLILGLVACKEPNLKEEEEEPTAEEVSRTQIITNGTFYDVANVVESNKYVKETVNDWSYNSGAGASSEGKVYGAIDLSDETKFNEERSKFSINNTMTYPGIDPETPYEKDDATKLQDANALLLASTKEADSMYYKNSSDFTLEKNTYYKLQFSVLTDIDFTDVPESEKQYKGARVIIDGGIYAEFANINTEGNWEKYEVYIEGNNYENRTIKIRLWFGHGPEEVLDETNVYLTKGAALFDNIICNEVSEEDFNGTIENENTKKESMIYPDTNLQQQSELSVNSSADYFYSFRSGSNSSSNATNYNMITGEVGLTTDKPTVDTPYTGIVDLSKMFRFDDAKTGDAKFISTYNVDHNKTTFIAPDRNDFMSDTGLFKLGNERELQAGSLDEYKSLMIFHDTLSGAGFKSKEELLIKKNTYYEISVWAYVWSTDIPEPSSSVVGTEPTEPDEDRPTTESIDNLEEAMLIAEAESNYANLTPEEKESLTQEQKDRIEAISPERKAVIYGLEQSEKDDLLTTYNEAKDDFEEATDLQEEWAEYDEDKENYDEKYAEYMEPYNQWKEINSISTSEDAYTLQPYAQFKVSGAGDLEAIKTDVNKIGEWQKLTYFIKGNQLSDRKVNLEFWFGEGSKYDYSTLMLGGVFFDNITITDYEQAQSGNSYDELSPFSTEDIDSGNYDIAQLVDYTGEIKFSNDDTLTENDLWEKELVDGTLSTDKDLLNFAIVDDESYPITIDGVEKYYNLLKMENTDYTASILNYRGEKDILANKCYRLSFWAKTVDIEEGFNAKIELMSKVYGSAEDMVSASSITDFNSEDWLEVVFYIKGDTLIANVVSLKFTLGSGNKFDTSKYIKGSLYISAMSIKEIEYDEYNASTKSGDKTKSYAFSNTASSSSESVTNANFGGIDLEDLDETALSDGKLVGIAPTSSWTVPDQDDVTTNGYNKPDVEIDKEAKCLKWENVVNADGDGPDGYEIYIQDTVKSNGIEDEDVEEIYIGYIDADDYDSTAGEGDSQIWNYKFDIVSKAQGKFVVKAVSTTGVSKYSDTVVNTVSEGAAYFTEYTATPKTECKIGTINYKEYTNDSRIKNIFNNSDYKSPYDTMLIMKSNYNVRANVIAPSKSLSENSYYEISIWLNTLDGAKASITFDDISDVLETRDVNDFIGYVNQDTNGKWVQYRFYVATDVQSSSIKLKLSMGNPYAKGTNGEEDSDTKVYGTDALTKGIILFDNVEITSLTEEQFNNKSGLTYKNNEDEDVSAEYYEGNEHFNTYEMVYDNNQFAFKVLTYTTDSFDSFTENDEVEEFDEDGTYNEGFYLGNTPNAYDWEKATDATNDDNARLYGVYSYLDNTKLDRLFTNDTNVDPFDSFLPGGFDIATFIKGSGNNTLVMSNLINNGQQYILNSSRSIAEDTYYKISFKAKTLLPDGKNAEFRFLYGGDEDNYTIIKINSAEEENYYDFVEYSFYIYNEKSSSQSVKWSFNLGGDSDEEKLLGMLVVDDIKFEEIDDDEYDSRELAFNALNETEQLESVEQFYHYDDEDTEDPENETDGTDGTKENFFDKGDTWLLVSTIVIGGVIIVVVVVVVIRRIKKKYPKKIKGENKVKTEKAVEFAPPRENEKEDIIVEDEFVDKAEEKPKYVQRVLPKKKKKKK